MGSITAKITEHLLILLPFPESKDILDRLHKRHPHMKITWLTVTLKAGHMNDHEPIPDELFESVTMISTLSVLPPLRYAHNIKLLHLNTAGVNHIEQSSIYTFTDINITTSSGIHGPAISEWVLMQILSHMHELKVLMEWQRQHRWEPAITAQKALEKVQDVVGMRLGVFGYGSIGRQTARVCKAMGMDVIAYTATPRTTQESRRDTGYIPFGLGDPDGSIPSAWYSGLDKGSVHDFLNQDIDILLIGVPLTKQTFHLLAEEEFKILGKRNALIINISRGGVIKQTDLVSALKKQLRDGGLRGAALDVTDPEPLPSDDEIWDLENVAITPHISGLSKSFLPQAFEILSQNIANLEEGKPLMNLVDRKKGY